MGPSPVFTADQPVARSRSSNTATGQGCCCCWWCGHAPANTPLLEPEASASRLAPSTEPRVGWWPSWETRGCSRSSQRGGCVPAASAWQWAGPGWTHWGGARLDAPGLPEASGTSHESSRRRASAGPRCAHADGGSPGQEARCEAGAPGSGTGALASRACVTLQVGVLTTEALHPALAPAELWGTQGSRPSSAWRGATTQTLPVSHQSGGGKQQRGAAGSAHHSRALCSRLVGRGVGVDPALLLRGHPAFPAVRIQLRTPGDPTWVSETEDRPSCRLALLRAPQRLCRGAGGGLLGCPGVPSPPPGKGRGQGEDCGVAGCSGCSHDAGVWRAESQGREAGRVGLGLCPQRPPRRRCARAGTIHRAPSGRWTVFASHYVAELAAAARTAAECSVSGGLINQGPAGGSGASKVIRGGRRPAPPCWAAGPDPRVLA